MVYITGQQAEGGRCWGDVQGAIDLSTILYADDAVIFAED